MIFFKFQSLIGMTSVAACNIFTYFFLYRWISKDDLINSQETMTILFFTQIFTTFALLLLILGESFVTKQENISIALKKELMKYGDDCEIVDEILIISEKIQTRPIRASCGFYVLNIQMFTGVRFYLTGKFKIEKFFSFR